MPVRRIVQVNPDALTENRAEGTILNVECAPVVEFDSALNELITDLTDTLFAHPVAIGLAAPQIGVDAQVAVINIEREDRDKTIVVVNPKILSSSGKKDIKRESCMSLPGYAGNVERRTKLNVSYLDATGKKIQQGVEGFAARVFMHEIDHLSGHLYTESMPDDSTLEMTDLFDYEQPEIEA